MSQLQRVAIAPEQINNQLINLTTDQQHYLLKVLRLREGDKFIAMDGKGKAWQAILTNTQAQILEPDNLQNELPINITLVVALPKGNNFDEVVRQATELGVICIVPVISDRTLLNPSPQKIERWRRIATEAAEQSERQIIPDILNSDNFSEYLSKINPNTSFTNYKYICESRGNYPHLLHCLQTQNLTKKTSINNTPSLIIAIGPEGGWTETEINQAIKAGFQPVSLGKRIFRAVTAPIVALSLVAAAWEMGKID